MTPVQIIYLTHPLKYNLTKKAGLQGIIFNIFQPTSTEAMSSYEDRFVKTGVVFLALYFESEVGDPQFFCISDIGKSLSDCSQTMKKICVVEVFRANILKTFLTCVFSRSCFHLREQRVSSNIIFIEHVFFF